MKAILLASGQSSRMKPLSDKHLWSLMGKPLLLHVAEKASQGGVSDFIVVANEDNIEAITALCQGDNVLKGAIIEVQEGFGQDRGALAGLKHLGEDEPVLVLCGNDYVDPKAYSAVIEQTHHHDGALLAKKVTEYFPGGYLSVDEQNIVTSIVEKPGEGKEPSDVINVVVHGFARSGDFQKALEKASSPNDDVYEVALDQLLQSQKIKAVPYEGPWQAVKYPHHLLALAEILLENLEGQIIHPSSQIAPTAVLDGPVVLEEGVKVFHNAVISGPCYVGKNVTIGNNALVRQSLLEEGATAGYNTEIARSLVGPHTTTHIAYVGDSVVDQGVNFGAFSCTANLRLDKKNIKISTKDQRIDTKRTKLGAIIGPNVQIGIHSCLMPGCRISTNIQPGEVVSRDQ